MTLLRQIIVTVFLLLNSFMAISQNKIYHETLPSIPVTDILEDDEGYIWMSTMHGIYRYDGNSYLSFLASNGSDVLTNDYVYDLCKDSYGNIWAATKSGLSCFHNGRFSSDANNSIISPIIRVLNMDENHIITTDERGITKIRISEDGSYTKVVSYYDNNCHWIDKIDISSHQDIWFTTEDDHKITVTILNSNLEKIHEIIIPQERARVIEIKAGINNAVWIASGKGIIAFDQLTFMQTVLPPEFQSELSHWHYFIEPVNDDCVILGTFNKGISLYNFRDKSIQSIPSRWEENAAYYTSMIDSRGDIWICSDKDEPICVSFNSSFKHETPKGGNTKHINQMFVDKDGILHLNTRYVYYSFDPDTGETVEDFNGRGFFTKSLLDSKGGLWISDGHYTMYRNELSKGKIIKTEKLSFDGEIVSVEEDHQGNIWFFKGEKGMEYLSEDGMLNTVVKPFEDSTKYYVISDTGNGNIIVSTNEGILYECHPTGLTKIEYPIIGISSIHTSSSGVVYLGTFNKGIVRYNPSNGETKVFNTDNGLVDNDIRAIQEDELGNIWICTSRQITRLEPSSDHLSVFFDQFFENDDFYELSCSCKDSDGNIYFGGNGGYTRITPSLVPDDYVIHNNKLKLEELLINGEQVEIQGASIELKKNQNNIEFRFTNLDFTSRFRKTYSYMLAGVDKNWIKTNENTAKYHNLKPGKYNFNVRTLDNSGKWSEDALSIGIRIRHSFWSSILAKIIYITSIIGLLYFINTSIITMRLQKERISLVEKKEEMQKEQLEFITNISHDFRTPLSLIYGPLHLLMKKDYIHSDDMSSLSMMEKNVSRLMNLSEKIMSASLEKTSDRIIKVSKNSLCSVIGNLSESFRYTALQKDISFKVENHSINDTVYFDLEKVEKILYNILSNAFKYTPERGQITFALYQNDDEIKFVISDTGIGIPEDKRINLFDRGNRLGAEGTGIAGRGIGLHYAQSLAKVHKGIITYEPNKPIGSIFSFTTPCRKESFNEFDIASTGTIIKENTTNKNTIDSDNLNSEKANIVLVEDNEDVRVFLRSFLSDKYNVATCSDGEEGFDKICNIVPDLVISDVMMPRKDGFSLCKDIKANGKLSHIPIVLLTAKTDVQSSITGLNEGAEAYIAKPFEPDYLMATINSLLDNRRKFHQYILSLTPSQIKKEEISEQISLSSVDKKFLENLQVAFEKEVSNSEANIDDIASHMNMSYSSLYGHVKNLTGLSPQAYLTIYRMNRAKELLECGEYMIADVAEMVGSSNQSNFTRSYKRQFGITPTEQIKLSKK